MRKKHLELPYHSGFRDQHPTINQFPRITSMVKKPLQGKGNLFLDVTQIRIRLASGNVSQTQNAPFCTLFIIFPTSTVRAILQSWTRGCVFWHEQNLCRCATRECIKCNPLSLVHEIVPFIQSNCRCYIW